MSNLCGLTQPPEQHIRSSRSAVRALRTADGRPRLTPSSVRPPPSAAFSGRACASSVLARAPESCRPHPPRTQEGIAGLISQPSSTLARVIEQRPRFGSPGGHPQPPGPPGDRPALLSIAVLPTFTFPLDHEQHPRTGGAGPSPSMPLSAALAPSRPRDPVVTGMTPGLLYRALTGPRGKRA